jgi:hypothetical protein
VAIIKPRLPEFVIPEAPAVTGVDAPPEWVTGKETEAPSSLTPAADWAAPGEYVAGEYLGMQESVGPNKSRLYHLRIADPANPKQTQAVSVWGSTILDTKMDLLNPPKGCQLFIQYLGTVETGKGLNPAKSFRVMMR